MNKNFEKFKKKIWIDILIKCAVAALLAAFLAVNAVLLPCKLYGIHILWVFYVLIGLGGFALGGGLAFLFLRTTDRKIAKRVDAELNLAERVQTACEFSGRSGEMLELQLEDAVKTVAPLPATSLRFKSLIATVLCAVIAVGAIVAVPVISYAVPSVYAEQGPTTTPTDPPRDISDWEWSALDELIKYVRASKKADAATITAMADELVSLKNLLLNGVSQSSLSAFVRNTVTNIRNKVRDINETYPSDGDEPHPQAALNTEEETYVINKLYEIFDLQVPSDDGNNQNGNNKEDGDENGDDPGKNTGTGGINLNSTPFFDPEKGYVICGEVRSEYYLAVQNALEEGVISKEEWEFIMITYFADLSVNEED